MKIKTAFILCAGFGKRLHTLTLKQPKPLITIKNRFNVNIGYSDHTPSIEASIAAVALGAKIIEKHFTLNKKDKGPDHQASLEPNEFKLMVIGSHDNITIFNNNILE